MGILEGTVKIKKTGEMGMFWFGVYGESRFSVWWYTWGHQFVVCSWSMKAGAALYFSDGTWTGQCIVCGL
ncbi:MAG TPA: hypothetical protein DCQ97_00510 [Chitinophagaceae bacterium]|nr:hypothetical protein [Chitinophagaceae bacterium]